MKHFGIGLTGALVVVLTGPAMGQTIGIGTTSPGSFTHSSGSAIAKVVSLKTDLKARVQPMGGTATRSVASGDVQFGLSNSFDTTFFVNGTGDYAGRGAKKNVRVAAVMTPLRVGLFVRKGSSVTSIKALKGKNLSSGFTAQKTIGRIIRAHLANAGLTYDDVRKVPAPNVVRAADDFGTSKTDALFFALGSAKILQVSARVGGVRALPIDPSPAAVARVRKILPGAYAMKVKPSKRLHGVAAPMDIVAFDFLFNTATEVPNEVVYKVVKAIHGNKKMLFSSFKGLGLFNPKRMTKKFAGLEFHAGAIKFYREAGQWPPK